MFEVEYKGANAVVLTTKKTRVVFDPKLSLFGCKDVSVKDSVEVVTEERFSVGDSVHKVFFDRPGEYEVGDVSITGIAARRHVDTENEDCGTTIYKLAIGGIKGVLLGNIQPKLSDEQLETIGVVDFVIVPVGGGGYTLDPTDAAAAVRQLDPKAVIPVHYSDPAISYDMPQAGVDEFIKELGASVIEVGSKWKVKKLTDIPESQSVINIARS